MVLCTTVPTAQAQFLFHADAGTDRAIHSKHTFHYEVSHLNVEAVSDESTLKAIKHLIANSSEFRFVQGPASTDSMGGRHVRWTVFAGDVELLGRELISHVQGGILKALNGTHVAGQIRPSLRFPISEEEALKTALRHVGAREHMWQFPEEEALLKVWTEDQSATYYPKGNKVMVPGTWNRPDSGLHSAWRFDIFARDPLMRYYVYVDAETGDLINSMERIHIINASGMAETKYSGKQRITTDSLSPFSFRLRETVRGSGIETYNLKTGTSYAAAVDFTDSNNYWNNTNASWDEVATDAHWGAASTYDYFWNKFGRNSYDNKGAKIRSYVHYSKNYNNAFWNGSVMTYGDGNGTTFTPLTALDVCGHEIAHAVTTNSANLVYSYESGALNESFSDIFGNSVEFYARPAQFAWNIGEDITPSGTGIRLMQNPKAKGHPDTYKGTNWRTGSADNGGVHSNSGVQNYWYYLLCEGGKDTNDNNEAYDVAKIGIHKAEQIAYRNLTVYLSSTSQYADARYFSIRSAADLFGECSAEVIAVTNAWHAVGVGPRYDSLVVNADFSGDTIFCKPPAFSTFLNRSSNAKAYHWAFGDGKTSTAVNPSNTYSAYGLYSVTLIAEGCYGNRHDTLIKTAYVQVDSGIDICNGYILPTGSYTTVKACDGFVYDNGGEGDYATLVRDTLTIDAYPADSIVLDFSVFDYEDKYDSVYIYDGPQVQSPKIGGYTGQTLPNGGRVVAYSGYVTIRHFSDPFVVGKGFKAKFKAYRPPLSLQVSADTTVCHGNWLTLSAKGSGGSPADVGYWWNGVRGDTSFNLYASRDTQVIVTFLDACTGLNLTDTIHVTVRPELRLVLPPDTTFCYRQAGVELRGIGSGGYPGTYLFRWLHSGSTSNPLSFLPETDTVLFLTLSDNCSASPDTAGIRITVKAPLTIHTSPDTLLCEGTRALLRVSGSGGEAPYSFTWSHGLGNAAQVWSLSSDIDTTYFVQISDACSGIGDSARIQVRYRPPLQLTMSRDTAICLGTSADIYALAGGGDSTNYSFSWSDGLPSLYRHQVKPALAERFAVWLTDGCSKTSVSDSVLVVVYPAISVSIIAADTICSGERILLRGNVTGGRVSTYQFSWNGGLGNAANAFANPAQDTTYRLVVSDGCSENDTAFKSLVVREALGILLPGDTSVCNGDSLSISASAYGGKGYGYTFFWDQGLGEGSTQTLKPRFSTTYRVTLNDGCSNYAERDYRVTVHPTPNVSFYAQPVRVCVGDPVQFNNTTPNLTGAMFSWVFGDGGSSVLESPSYVYSRAGLFDVSLSVLNSAGCTGSLTKTAVAEVLERPIADFTADPTTASIENPEVEFINQSMYASSFSWYFGDGLADTSFQPTHTYTDTGHYTAVLHVSNEIGCEDEISRVVRVRDLVLMHIPNAFTPNGDTRNPVFRPVIRGLRSYEFTVYNRWGEVLYRTQEAGEGWNGIHPDGTAYPPGVYWYSLEGLDVDRNKLSESGTFLLFR